MYVPLMYCTSYLWKADVKYLMGRQNVDFNKPYDQQHGPVITNVVRAVCFPISFYLVSLKGSRFKRISPDLTRKIGPPLLQI